MEGSECHHGMMSYYIMCDITTMTTKCRFDIYSLDKSAQQDEDGILKATSESEIPFKILFHMYIHVIIQHTLRTEVIILCGWRN